eukprot:jgi/Botrbrau1/22655/Bobra.0132s0001.1
MTEASLQPPKSLIPKTAAKELFCVSDKELQGLNFIEKPLKRFKRLRMKLYDQEEVKALAMQKFGDEAKLEEARHDRLQKRIKRSHKRVQEMPARELRTDTPLNEAFREEMPQEVSQESSQVLHPFIQERIRHLHDGFGATGQYVLYWMRTALRTHENPALDVARNEARRRGLPLLLCAFVLTEGHPAPYPQAHEVLLGGPARPPVGSSSSGGAPSCLCGGPFTAQCAQWCRHGCECVLRHGGGPARSGSD